MARKDRRKKLKWIYKQYLANIIFKCPHTILDSPLPQISFKRSCMIEITVAKSKIFFIEI